MSQGLPIKLFSEETHANTQRGETSYLQYLRQGLSIKFYSEEAYAYTELKHPTAATSVASLFSVVANVKRYKLVYNHPAILKNNLARTLIDT